MSSGRWPLEWRLRGCRSATVDQVPDREDDRNDEETYGGGRKQGCPEKEGESGPPQGPTPALSTAALHPTMSVAQMPVIVAARVIVILVIVLGSLRERKPKASWGHRDPVPFPHPCMLEFSRCSGSDVGHSVPFPERLAKLAHPKIWIEIQRGCSNVRPFKMGNNQA